MILGVEFHTHCRPLKSSRLYITYSRSRFSWKRSWLISFWIHRRISAALAIPTARPEMLIAAKTLFRPRLRKATLRKFLSICGSCGLISAGIRPAGGGGMLDQELIAANDKRVRLRS